MASFKITRRQFLKWASASAAVLGLSQTDLLKWQKDLEAAVTNCTPTFPSTFGRVIWITGADCGGCPTSLLNYLANPSDPDPALNAVANNALGLSYPDIEVLTPQGGDGHIDIAEVVLEIVTVDWHYIVQAASGDPANQHMATLRDAGGYVLAIDGAIQSGASGQYCAVFDIPGDHSGGIWDSYIKVYPNPNAGSPGELASRTEFSMAGATLWLATNADAVVAHGTCASFGGVPAASASLDGSLGNRGNLTGAKSAWEWINGGAAHGGYSLGKTIVNVPGCPPHPDWLINAVACYILTVLGVPPPPGGLPWLDLDTSLDHLGRPRLTNKWIYHAMDYAFCLDCPRNPTRPGPSDLCLAARTKANESTGGLCMENRGCTGWMMGPAHIRPDCPTRKWNNFEDMSKNNWCVQNNMPCQGCASPGFPDYCSPFYKKAKYKY